MLVSMFVFSFAPAYALTPSAVFSIEPVQTYTVTIKVKTEPTFEEQIKALEWNLLVGPPVWAIPQAEVKTYTFTMVYMQAPACPREGRADDVMMAVNDITTQTDGFVLKMPTHSPLYSTTMETARASAIYPRKTEILIVV